MVPQNHTCDHFWSVCIEVHLFHFSRERAKKEKGSNHRKRTIPKKKKRSNCIKMPSFVILCFLVSLGLVQGWLVSSSSRSSRSGTTRCPLHPPTTKRLSLSSTTVVATATKALAEPSDPPRTHPTFETQPVDIATALSSTAPSAETEQALATLAATILALLAGDEAAALALTGGSAEQKKNLIQKSFQAYDVCESGTLSVEEARALFVDLARNIIHDLAATPASSIISPEKPVALPQEEEEMQQSSMAVVSGNISSSSSSQSLPKTAVSGAARAHAQRVLAMEEAGNSNTIERIATKLLLMADPDGDGRVSLSELANLFDTVHAANVADARGGQPVETFPQPLRALAGSLHLLPAIEGRTVSEAASEASEWNIGIPGDDHTLRRVELEKGKLSIVGLGRSADASAYFLPELGLCLDAGIHVKSIHPKTILLSHAHRDHIAALPTHAATKAKIICPSAIHGLVRRFLLAEAQLNYGNAEQTDEQTIAALGDFDVQGVEDGEEFLLPKKCYQGSPTPLGVQVFRAPHKQGVPAVSYGIFRAKTRLKSEYASCSKSELGKLIQQDIKITESFNEGLLFYSGDTTIDLLKERWEEILPKYKYVIHEVTFLGKPSAELDEMVKRKGHTHYAQLHPWICAFPETTFVCVHWSLRYSREDVVQYFEKEYGGVPKNVVLWV